MPRVLSTCFPGVEFSEHGNFSVSAKEQQDGSVLVDITSIRRCRSSSTCRSALVRMVPIPLNGST